MSLSIEEENNVITIFTNKKFDFTISDDFKKAYQENIENQYIIDFRETDYIDSSGLGMLLNMKRTIKNENITLKNCKPQVKRVLAISRFDEQFTIT